MTENPWSPAMKNACTILPLATILALLPLAGCDSSEAASSTDTAASDAPGSGDAVASGDSGPNGLVLPDSYAFESALSPGASSVSYSGQILRHVLIADLDSWIAGLGERIDTGAFMPATDGDVVETLDFYFRFDSESNGASDLLLSSDPKPKQATYDDISSDKDIVGKLAGNDPATDHAAWKDGAFKGWSDPAIATHGGGIDTPEKLVVALFETLEANAIGRAEGTLRHAPDGKTVLPVYVTEAGQDLRQLIHKIVLMGVAFSQGTDDYLDDASDGKGLKADNTVAVDGKPYTELAHAWDEGWGYFGASRGYGARSDADIAETVYEDADGDGGVDLTSEWCFGASVNAAKRDAGAAKAGAATDFTKQAWDGFRTGRAIIAAAAGRALSAEETSALAAARDQAVAAWEAAIAATCVHYVNDTLKDMAKLGTADHDFAHHAKVWSELKGFAIGLQFNPRSPLSDADFAKIHELIGDAPVVSAAEAAAYATKLREARGIFQRAYGFDAALIGDDSGQGGW